MRKTRRSLWFSVAIFLLCLGSLIFIPGGKAAPGSTLDLTGGPRGVVRSAAGFPIEGMMVQLISQKTSIRTTVYTNQWGQYEFPKLEAGTYTLRTPRPLEFKRYLKESVRITGADKFEDIVLDRVSNSEFLPPTPDIIAQLSDAEWLFNMDGTAQEKKIFSNYCGAGCHTYQMPFRSRFDERSWRLILHRMLDYSGRILQGPGEGDVTPEEQAEREILVKWLARVRGPDAKDAPFKVFPRPHGPATRAVITEYELPWLGVHVHDAFGDTKSDNIWFDINRSPFIGKLDPNTGKVTSWRIPGTEGKHPGAHWIQAEKDGTVWYSETWSSSLIKFNPLTAAFHKMSSGVQGNMALAPDGTIWRTARGKVARFDRETAKIVETFPPDDRKVPGTYGNFVSWDGRYFGGGNRDRDFDGVVFFDRQTKEVRMIPSPSGVSGASRGSFDPFENIWVGGRGGVLVKYDHKNNVIAEYAPPTPWNTFYETRADKNGEVWAGEMRAGRMARFNPKTEQWIEYVLPEPFSFDWQTYVDNSTDPVNVWYGDQYGYIVHIQPLDGTVAATPTPNTAVAAKTSPQPSSVAGDLDSQLDPYQRSGLIYYNKLMGKSGADRGQHIYYLKCWICHNEYAIASDPKGAAPTLKDLYKRPTLLSGRPVNDENVAAKIRDGGPRMPTYRHGIGDTDMADLLTYLRGKCCWDADHPPANPRYKGQ